MHPYFFRKIILQKNAKHFSLRKKVPLILVDRCGDAVSLKMTHHIPTLWFSDFSKCSMPKALWNFEKSSNMAKNEERPCSSCHQTIFWLIPGTQKSDFRYPFHHLKKMILMSKDSPNNQIILYYKITRSFQVWRK